MPPDIATLAHIPDVQALPVLVRLDFNVPVAEGRVVNDYRIKKSLPTIDFLRQRKAKVIILSHIEGASDTLRPVYEYLKRHLPISFCPDILAEGPLGGAAMIEKMKEGDVLLCENIRQYPGEKKNDPSFAKKLAALGTVYVNDAFSVAHRAHASVVGLAALLPGFLGLQFEKEIAALSSCFSPAHPFLFILAGAKFETKLPLVQKFLTIADNIFIGGALANDIYKVRGLGVGISLVSDMGGDDSLEKLATDKKITVPADVVVHSEQGTRTVLPDQIGTDEAVVDAGPQTLEALRALTMSARHILWNGPLGAYERGFVEPTKALAKIVAEATGRGAKTIIGGGDTLAAAGNESAESLFTFVSTGGGAMLDFLAAGTLPGLEALKRHQ